MLETTWFVIWGVAWAVYLMLDGYDLGLGMLFPFLAKNEMQKRMIINSMGPFWDGNEVWLITAGGVTFAAFPKTYAVMFSTLYTPLMLLLFALILRGVAFEFRGKENMPWWKFIWDSCLVFGSALPALVLGVFFASLFRGIPVDANGVLQGGLLSLVNPYVLLGGVTFVLIFAVHGGLWLTVRTDKELQFRAAWWVKRLWLFESVAIVAFLVYTGFDTRLWQNTLAKPALLVFPLLAVAGLLLLRVFLGKGHYWRAWFASAGLIVSTALFGVFGMFPGMLISSIDPNATLTVYNSASSPLSLKIMLGVALSVLPFVIGYQIWVHLKFKDAGSEESISRGPAY